MAGVNVIYSQAVVFSYANPLHSSTNLKSGGESYVDVSAEGWKFYGQLLEKSENQKTYSYGLGIGQHELKLTYRAEYESANISSYATLGTEVRDNIIIKSIYFPFFYYGASEYGIILGLTPSYIYEIKGNRRFEGESSNFHISNDEDLLNNIITFNIGVDLNIFKIFYDIEIFELKYETVTGDTKKQYVTINNIGISLLL